MSWMGLHVVDWIVVGAYLALVTVLGTLAFRKVKNMEDFFMGGRRFGKIFMMFFAFGAGTSSEQAVGVVAGTWRAGLAGIWWQFLWLWATPFYWIVAPIIRRMRALTTSDFFQARFDTSTATLYSAYGILTAIVFIAGTVFAGGKMANALTGGELDRAAERMDLAIVPSLSRAPSIEDDSASPMEWRFSWQPLTGYHLAGLAITVMFVIYGMAGGLGAAVVTDFIQGILTIVLSFLLLPWVFGKIGGLAALKANADLKPGMLELFGRPEVARILGREPLTPFFVVMLSLVALTGIVVQPHIMGVCGAGKTEFEGRFGFTVGNFLKRMCTIAWTFIGLACIVWYLNPELGAPIESSLRDDLRQVNSDELESLPDDRRGALTVQDKAFADELFGRAAADILPGVSVGLIGLLLASLLAANMSSCDAQMIVASGLFTENIYKRFVARERTQGHYVAVGRIAALIIVMFALLLQLTFTDVIHALKIIIQTPAAIGISLWIGVVWRGWTPAAVWASSTCAYLIWGMTAWVPHWFDHAALQFMLRADKATPVVSTPWSILLYLSAGLVVGLIVSACTRRTDKEQLDQFFLVMRTPVREGEEVAAPVTLPKNPDPPLEKMFDHPDIEIPKFNRVDILGFAASWALVGAIIWFVVWLAG